MNKKYKNPPLSRSRQLGIAALAGALLLVQQSPKAFATGWQQDAQGWWYGSNAANTSWYADGWKWIEGEDGIARQYYFGRDGYLYTDTTTPDGYTVNAEGAWTVDGVVQEKRLQDTGDDAAQEISDDGPLSDNEEADETERDDQDESNPVVAANDENNANTYTTANDNAGANVSVHVDTEPEEERNDAPVVTTVGPGGNENPQGNTETRNNDAQKQRETGGSRSSLDSWEDSVHYFYGERTEAGMALPKSEPTELVTFARQYVNVLPYVYAGTSLESGTDCSGFVYAVFQHFGMTVPRSSAGLYSASTPITGDQLKPGDLVFYFKEGASTPHHVGIYTGNGSVVHNTQTGDYVREMDACYYPRYAFGRILNR